MSFIYTQSDIEERMNAGIQGKKGILSSVQETLNASVRELISKVDLRSTRRKQTLTPNLYNGIYDYSNPSDMKAQSIIDIPAQAQRADGEWMLIPSEEFERNKKAGVMSIDSFNGSSILRLSSQVDSDTLIFSELDSLTSGGGTWIAFGDAENLEADDSDYVKGSGSIKFDINSDGGTTVGIENTSLNSIDISDYLGGTSSFFVWTKINSITNITNYILRFGSDSSNYHTKTITSKADGTSFSNGWNLLKFDVTSLTDTGTPVDTTISYISLYMTKDTSKISETDYKFDYLVLKKGIVHDVKYYGKYAWQDSSGTYLENSTSSSDFLVADTDEFNLFIKQSIINAKKEIGFNVNEIKEDQRELMFDINNYLSNNPSEAKLIMYDYYNFITGDTSDT